MEVLQEIVEPAVEANNSKTSNVTENGELFDCEQLLMSDEDDGHNTRNKHEEVIKKNSKLIEIDSDVNNYSDDHVKKSNTLVIETKSSEAELNNSHDETNNSESDNETNMIRSRGKRSYKLNNSDSESELQLINLQSDKEISNKINVIKKPFKLIDSDSSNMQSDKENSNKINFVKKPFKLIDSDSDPSQKNNSSSDKESSKNTNVSKKSFKLIDSDSDEKSQPPPMQLNEKKSKKVKKLKTKKHRDQSIVNRSSIDSDSDDSVSAGSCNKRVKNSLKNICDEESSMSGSQTTDNDDNVGNIDVNPVKRPPQRMSAKEAENQMKEIKSYSQKFAREANIDVPYHKPKQYSIKEFMSRRNAIKPTAIKPSNLSKKKTVLEIKMSKEELVAYAQQIEQRQKEALEFFKNENEIPHSQNKIASNKNQEYANEKPTQSDEDINVISGLKNNPEICSNTEIETNITDQIVEKMSIEEGEPLKESSVYALKENELENLIEKNTEVIIMEDKNSVEEEQKEINGIVTRNNAKSNKNIDELEINIEDDSMKGKMAMEKEQDENDGIVIDKNERGISSRLSRTEDKVEKSKMDDTNHSKSLEIDFVDEKAQEKSKITIDECETDPSDKEQTVNMKECTVPSLRKPEIDYNLFSFDQKSDKLTLKGDPDSLIDLETGDIVAKAPTGPEELFKRFLKHKKKAAHRDTEQLGLCSTDYGRVNLDIITVHVHDDDEVIQESAPGSAYVKLKMELGEKIANDRRKECLKRLQDLEKERKEEMEEFSDCGYNDEIDEEEEEVAVTKKMIEENEEEIDNEHDDVDDDDNEDNNDKEEFDNDENKNELIDNESEDDDEDKTETENHDNEGMADEEKSSESSSSSDNDDEIELNHKPKQGRILAAFQDSDEDENHVNEFQKPSSPQVLHKSVSDMFKSQDYLESQIPLQQQQTEYSEPFSMPSFPFNQTQITSSQINQPTEDELIGLCSGRFESTQKPESNSNLFTQNANLFSQTQNTQIDTNDLMALCSGTFETQIESSSVATPNVLEFDEDADKAKDVLKAIFESSDDETANKNEESKKKNMNKKRKRKNLICDDDDNEDILQCDLNHDKNELEESGNSNSEPEAEEVENCIDYDSEENEIEVKMTKPIKEKYITNFIENEAELSESEWGSADEDEKDIDKYEIELGDEDEFDSIKVQQELERMHVRKVIDQDLREVKAIQDMLFDEEEDGADRDRKFRWKNVDNLFNPEDGRRALDNDQGPASDEENEEIWRKMRHERNSLLQSDEYASSQVSVTSTTISLDNNTVGSGSRKRLTVVRTKTSLSQTETSTKKDSPFLISKSAPLLMSSRGSFLSRDQSILQRLALTTKNCNETEKAVGSSKGCNYVFATLSPLVENPSTKRKMEDSLNDQNDNVKKKKIVKSEKPKSKKQLLLDHLN